MSNPQAGFTASYPHLLDEQAKHLAYIIQTGIEKGLRKVEVREEAEAGWVEQCIDKARNAGDFFENCTPGYYNNEGKTSELSAQNGFDPRGLASGGPCSKGWSSRASMGMRPAGSRKLRWTGVQRLRTARGLAGRSARPAWTWCRRGLLQPSADQIAERAGVSRRSVFNHFNDLGELYDAVAEAGMQRCAPPAGGNSRIASYRSIATRGAIGQGRGRGFSKPWLPVTRALTAQALVGPAAEQAIRVSRAGLRRRQKEVERLFGNELEGLDPQERGEIVEAMSAATCPLLWEYLRRSAGNSMPRARAVMQRTLSAILRDVRRTGGEEPPDR